MHRSPKDLHAHADELADAFEAYEPSAADFDAPLPTLVKIKVERFRRAFDRR